jgi:hypothetical protein
VHAQPAQPATREHADNSSGEQGSSAANATAEPGQVSAYREELQAHLIAIPPRVRDPIGIAFISGGAVLLFASSLGFIAFSEGMLPLWAIYVIFAILGVVAVLSMFAGLVAIFPENLTDQKPGDTPSSNTSDTPAPQPGDSNRADLIEIEQLADDTIEAIAPFLPAGSTRISEEELHALLKRATQLLAARQRYAEQETKAIDAQNTLALAEDRAAYLASLSRKERALLHMRLEAAAAADAGAIHDCVRLECELSQLRAALDACEDARSNHGECR